MDTNSVISRYELDECAKWLTSNNYISTALQFESHDMKNAAAIVKQLTKFTSEDNEFYIIVSPSCTVDYIGPLHLGTSSNQSVVDSIVCFGVRCLTRTQTSLGRNPVLFVFPQNEEELDFNFLKSSLSENDVFKENLLVLYSLEHVSLVNKLINEKVLNQDILNNNFGKIVKNAVNWNFPNTYNQLIVDEDSDQLNFGHFAIKKPIRDYNGVLWIGQCDNLSLKVNSPSQIIELILSDHTTNLIKTPREVMKRASLIEKAKTADKIGIVISNSIPAVGDLFEKLEYLATKANKQLYFISLIQFVDETKFGNFGELEAFVIVTSCNCYKLCQRIRTHVPLITLIEFEIALGLKRSYGNLIWNEDGPEMASLLPEVEPLTSINSTTDLMEYKLQIKGSWFGLQVNAGQDEVKPVQEGLKGVASSYNEEPNRV